MRAADILRLSSECQRPVPARQFMMHLRKMAGPGWALEELARRVVQYRFDRTTIQKCEEAIALHFNIKDLTPYR